MNNINITTELCAEDRARIDKLTAALEDLVGVYRGPTLEMVGTPFQAVKSEEPTPAEPLYEEGTGINDLGFIPIETDDEDEPEAPQEAATPKHTAAELQQKVVGIVSKGKKEEVKEIIKQYAAKVSEIPEDKIDEVWAKLDKLEA